MYEVAYHPAFRKDLKKLPEYVLTKLEALIKELQVDPFQCGRLSGDLGDVFRCKLKAGGVEYRLAYIVEKQRIIILMFKKRESFYEYLRRRLRV